MGKASEWQRPAATVRIRTSCEAGRSTWMSSTVSPPGMVCSSAARMVRVPALVAALAIERRHGGAHSDTDLVERLCALVKMGSQRGEPVDQAGVTASLDAHARVAEAHRVGL